MWYQRLEKADGTFFYVDVDRQVEVNDLGELERIEKLHIPKAYQNVMIHKNRRAKVQAYGYDARGRKQVMYASWFVQKQAVKKYAKVVEVDEYMPQLIDQIKADIRSQSGKQSDKRSGERSGKRNGEGNKERSAKLKEQMVAVVLYLMIACGFRIGNEKYLAANNSYGLTTLEVRHVRIKPREHSIHIQFVGKKGVDNYGVIHREGAPDVYKFLRRAIAGKDGHDRVFEGLSSEDVNDYLRRIHPDITSKDIRTWNANNIFLSHIMNQNERQNEVMPVTETGVTRMINTAIDKVAIHLHHTRDVCKKNYLHPDYINFARIIVVQRERPSISHALA